MGILLNCYHVIVNGNRLVYSNTNKKPCVRMMLSLAKDRLTLVEIWYYHHNGQRSLVDYRNKCFSYKDYDDFPINNVLL